MITKEEAMTCHMFYHISLKNRDGSAVRVRANGKCKVWKTRPNDFRLPVKHGLRECFYISSSNAHQWITEEPINKIEAAKKLKLSEDVPDGVLRDAMLDAGMIRE